MFDSLRSIKSEEDLEKAKRIFLDRVTFTSQKDCQFIVKTNVYFKDFFEAEEDFIENALKNFNENKSFLFGYSVNREQLSNVKCQNQIYEVPSCIIKNAETVSIPPLFRLQYLIADIKNEKDEMIGEFYFPPVIDFVTEDEFESFEFDKYQVASPINSGTLLLIELKKELRQGKEEDSFLSASDFNHVEYNYQLSHNNGETTVHNRMKIIKENSLFGAKKYQAVMNIQTDCFDNEEEVKVQLYRWLQRLGKGLEIADVVL